MKRPESHFPKMSREARAGQFASFAALSGHEEAIHQTAMAHEEEYGQNL
ncbi:MAG: hypothetical protein UD286_05640 [Bacteroidales bacterium]|nr:hypothetical protein [Bacteroidales bacterium]MEE0340788.1 hypothetical protein [Bacteroidales bacterium]